MVLGMTLNCIWGRNSSSESLESVTYPFVAILTQRVPVRVLSESNESENYSYSMGSSANETLKKHQQKM